MVVNKFCICCIYVDRLYVCIDRLVLLIGCTCVDRSYICYWVVCELIGCVCANMIYVPIGCTFAIHLVYVDRLYDR